MAMPRALIGSGVGALSGAVGGAATGGSDQTLVQRAGRGILGGMAGAAAGGAGHTALRYGGLRRAGYAKGLGALDEAAMGAKSLSKVRADQKAYGKAVDAAKKVDAQKAQQAAKGFDLTGSQAEIKVKYRALARKHHPDAGGDQEKFQALNKAYRDAMAAAKMKASTPPPTAPAPQQKPQLLLTTTKTSSASFEDIAKIASFYHELGLNSNSEAELLYAINCLRSLAL